MNYVKIEKGKIVEGPITLSASESASPNSNWGDDQLRANGWFLVDLSHDPLTEKIDYENPIINGDYITYPRISLSNVEQKIKWNEDCDKKRRSEYPTIEELTIALWEASIEDRIEAAQALQAKRELVKAKYPKK